MSVAHTQSNYYNSTSAAMSSLKSMFTKEGETLLNASKCCEELWHEMRGADFRKEGLLNEKNIQLILENKRTIIFDLLKISDAEDFIDVFDCDQDGFLNEDEQILVFTMIKERIQVIAEELCLMKRYEIYRDLMKEVRAIEKQINRFQNELRQNVHQKQLQDYKSIGVEMQHEFDSKWDQIFKDYEIRKNTELDFQKKNLDKINELVFQRELNKINSLKLKQNNNIKLLQNQERLVAINERVDEAANFRNELKVVRRNDELRLEKAKEEAIKNLNNKISKDTQLEVKKRKDRLDLEKFNLMIEKNKLTDVLSKQINLHIKDIERIQKAISTMYVEHGEKNDELKRDKDRQKTSNSAISAFKANNRSKSMSLAFKNTNSDLARALMNLPSKTLTLNSSMESTSMSKTSKAKKNIIALKYMIKTLKLTKFDINTNMNDMKFVNVKGDNNPKDKSDNNLKKKIVKLLEQRKHKDEILIPPCEYYDDKMNIVVEAKNYRDILPRLHNNINNIHS